MLLASGLLSIASGSASDGLLDGLSALWRPAEPAGIAVWQFRLPRFAAALAAGGALALSGAVLQAVIRNPLAEPGVLGLNAGAALAIVVLVVSVRAVASPFTLAATASVGGVAAAVAVYLLSWRNGADPQRLVLSGILVGALCGALITLFSLQGNAMDVQRALRWTSGSLNGTTWREAGLALAGLVVLAPVVWAVRRDLDIMALDPASSVAVGLPLERSRLMLVLLAVLLSSVGTAAVGIVVFVGLAAPHLARSLAGPLAASYLPAAVLLGGLICALADLIGRTVFAPVQFPAGMICALVGGPYFLWLMWSGQRRYD